MKRIWFLIKQAVHNSLSILSVSAAILAAAGWVESGHYGRSVAALFYFGVWMLAQYTPAKDGKYHNETLINHGGYEE